jgi:hypothetical protein
MLAQARILYVESPGAGARNDIKEQRGVACVILKPTQLGQ